MKKVPKVQLSALSPLFGEQIYPENARKLAAANQMQLDAASQQPQTLEKCETSTCMFFDSAMFEAVAFCPVFDAVGMPDETKMNARENQRSTNINPLFRIEFAVGSFHRW